MTEIEQRKAILEKELGAIDSFQRLRDNPDFRVFRKEIDDIQSELRGQLELAPKDKVEMIQGELKLARTIFNYFDGMVERRAKIVEEIEQLTKT